MQWQSWQDVLADKALCDLPYKIELTERGTIELSPISVKRSYLQGKLASGFDNIEGKIFISLPISIGKSVKVSDVAWGSKEYHQKHRNDIAATSAPEICIEVMSPSNTKREMKTKVNLYLKAGAIEVWLVNESGQIQYFDKNGQKEASDFDVKIENML